MHLIVYGVKYLKIEASIKLSLHDKYIDIILFVNVNFICILIGIK